MCSGEADFLQGFTALLIDVSLRERFEKNPRGVAALLCADESAAVMGERAHRIYAHWRCRTWAFNARAPHAL